MEEKIREELYSKLESEFDSYKKELETLTSKEIIDKSYETTMKEELMCLFYPESQRYDLDEIKALKNEKNSLETLYQGWMDSDLNINQLLEDNTDEIVAELAEEYKAKQSKKKEKEKVNVTTILFDDEVEIIHDRFPIDAVQPLTDKEYYVRGCTALLDAVGHAINKIDNVQKHLPEEHRAGKVLFVITTDGLENSSTEFNYNNIKRMIEAKK